MNSGRRAQVLRDAGVDLGVGLFTFGPAALIGIAVLGHSLYTSILSGFVAFATVELALRGLRPGNAVGLEASIVFVIMLSVWSPDRIPGYAKWQWTAALILLPAAGFCLGRLYRRCRTATMGTETH